MKFTLLTLFILLGCSDTQSISRTQVIMDTFCTITLEEDRSKQIDVGFEHLKNVEHSLSSYQSDALVSRLNKERSLSLLPTQTILKDILEKAKAYHAQTNGYFDVTIGSITKKLYHFGETEKIPSKKALSSAVLGIDYIRLDENIIALDANITVDLGGIGKGYGVDSLAEYYVSKAIHKGIIALSGDIRCLGSCEIGIQNPFEKSKVLTTFSSKIKNLSISTSGTYRRYVQEKKHHHLMNPKTKTQGRSFISVTIVANADNTLCDVMATAISAMPEDVALKFVKSQDTFGYLLVSPEGEEISGNLEKFVTRH